MTHLLTGIATDDIAQLSSNFHFQSDVVRWLVD